MELRIEYYNEYLTLKILVYRFIYNKFIVNPKNLTQQWIFIIHLTYIKFHNVNVNSTIWDTKAQIANETLWITYIYIYTNLLIHYFKVSHFLKVVNTHVTTYTSNTSNKPNPTCKNSLPNTLINHHNYFKLSLSPSKKN